MKRRFPLHVHISTLFLTLILIVGGVIGGLGYKISRDILETTASDLSAREIPAISCSRLAFRLFSEAPVMSCK